MAWSRVNVGSLVSESYGNRQTKPNELQHWKGVKEHLQEHGAEAKYLNNHGQDGHEMSLWSPVDDYKWFLWSPDLLLNDPVKSKCTLTMNYHLMGISDFALQREGAIVSLLPIHFREHLSLFRRQLYQSGHRSHLGHIDREHQVYRPICLTAALQFILWMMLWTRTCWQ